MNSSDRRGTDGWPQPPIGPDLRFFARLRARLLRLARRAWARSERYDAPVTPHAAAGGSPQDPDGPSERIALAYELARRQVPATWIAARCALPHAFAELIVAEVADTPGTTPRRRD
ncbi:hypothetical protein KDK95_18305 [Actinospica sp. MGRD01-02]|uniref:Uncharacterized protein n=1 Tax=Actinospica acidithermotolerans TaxID=2828514 RepID=A0A941ED52_9ACTN|nr:hypothetical protein [Actinospica acidithermotolerans]MBR7828273.1 hypothetical protein [Actinospica acidithermotolerans]